LRQATLDSYDGAMRCRLRTLLIVLALGPPLLAVLCSIAYLGWAWSNEAVGTDATREELERARAYDPEIQG
jgi:hypothetical protein